MTFMTQEKKTLSPEGELIETARKRLGLSQNAAAREIGISGTRWRQIVKGTGSTEGVRVAVRGGADTVAKMASLMGLSSQEMKEAGRPDVARKLTDADPQPASATMWDGELHAPAAPLDGQEWLRWRQEPRGRRYRLELANEGINVEHVFGADESPEEVIDDLRDLLEPHRAAVRQMERRRARR